MDKIYLLNDDKYEDIVNLPMIRINFFKKEIDLDPYDALIFTSKNGVRAIDKIDKTWIKKEIYSIGQGTSREIKKYNANLVYTAKNSYGDLFAQEIKESLKNKEVLFVRAKEVTSKLNQILKNARIHLKEEVMYETTCRAYTQDKKPKDNSIIIFTSPSTVKCFLKNFKWNDTYRAISIGEVTAGSIPSSIKKSISEKQTILSCIELAKSYIQYYLKHN
ncbi:MAG: uroporphyrinogen-III synthase [Sulfurospirillum sp.]